MLKEKGKASVKVQDFGRFLSGMVMPNIGAFIAWGLITAFFIPTGWIPNENLGQLVDPMVSMLLPILIGYTGGKMVGDTRGGVVGAVATMGVIVGAEIPMFLGAMIMGPLGGFAIKKFDEVVEGKVKSGFEMLVNNFSAGIIGMILAILAFKGIGPLVTSLTNALIVIVEKIVAKGLLPLASVIIEPAKILFLNNAINHGVLGPIGLQEAQETGKSIFFLLETNPGPGLGILLAYFMFGRDSVKQSTPSAMIIHFLGGIHEIYFPYVLMNPALILAVMAGGASGVLTFSLLGAGLSATPSPGSIIALLAMTPKGSFLGVILGVLVSIVVTFLVASIFVKRASAKGSDESFEEASEKMRSLKNRKNGTEKVSKIIVACDAGMGSSAMGASLLKKKMQKAGLDILVTNSAINELPEDVDIVITQKTLTDRAKKKRPNAEHISIEDFISTPVYDELVSELSKTHEVKNIKESTVSDDNGVLQIENIFLNLDKVSRDEAIKLAGEHLKEAGFVKEGYTLAMLNREKTLSTYIGNNVAIPHGESGSEDLILKSGIVVLQFKDGVDFDGEKANLVIGIAGKNGEHLSILSKLATILEDEENARTLIETESVEKFYNTITI